MRLISEVSTHKLQVLIRTLLASILTLVITKGYGARATTIEGQNAFALLKRCALLKFHVI